MWRLHSSRRLVAGSAISLAVIAVMGGGLVVRLNRPPAPPAGAIAVGKSSDPGTRRPQSDASSSEAKTKVEQTSTAQPCTDASQLSATYEEAAADTSDIYYIFVISNAGSACTLTGAPSVAQFDASGLADPVIHTVNVTTSSSMPVTIGSGPAQPSSFYADFYPECPVGANSALDGPYDIQLSFAGLAAPVHVRTSAILAQCDPQTVVVSPVTAGIVTIPGFTTGGTPPAFTPLPGPSKSPGATP